jgi:branched-chain amino acid transport system ATP-binding protein
VTRILEVDELTAGYGGAPVLDGVSLTVEQGEMAALLGPNGAGKSTTLLCLAGELAPSAGTVRFRGAALRGPLYARARRGVSFVPEQVRVFAGLTVKDNLALGLGPIESALDAAPDLRRLLDRPAGLLSGGEQQMITLARSLAAQPALLLVDEVTLGLAPMVAERMLGLLRLAADRGAAVLVVEQQANRALRHVDRGYVIQRGRIVMHGTAAELSASEQLEQVYLGG